MSFSELKIRSDQRILCGILANQFLRDLNPSSDRRPDDAGTVCLVNLMRLLDLYRHEVMTSIPDPPGILEREPLETVGWPMLMEDPFTDIEQAMLSAQNTVFGKGCARNDACHQLRMVLRQRLAGKAPNIDAAKLAERFFEELVKQLTEIRNIQKSIRYRPGQRYVCTHSSS